MPLPIHPPISVTSAAQPAGWAGKEATFSPAPPQEQDVVGAPSGP